MDINDEIDFINVIDNEKEFHQDYWINIVPYKPLIIHSNNCEVDFIEENSRKKIKFKEKIIKKSKKNKKSKKSKKLQKTKNLEK